MGEPMPPDHDPVATMQRLVGIDFPFDFQRTFVDLAFVKLAAAPRVGGLFHANGYLAAFTQKRYDDTSIALAELIKHGYDSERGAAMIDRMNRIHAGFKIGNEEHLYVLVTLLLEPIRWNARFGWRAMTAAELAAQHAFWREVGRRMHITDIPDTLAGCAAFQADYERREHRRTRASVELAEVMFVLMESWFPGLVRPLVRPVVCCLVEPELLAHFDLAPPPRPLRMLVHLALRGRALALRWAPRRRTPSFYCDRALRSYPRGYTAADIGPPAGWKRPR